MSSLKGLFVVDTFRQTLELSSDLKIRMVKIINSILCYVKKRKCALKKVYNMVKTAKKDRFYDPFC